MFISIWCEDKNRGIGKNNKLPWNIKEDLNLFKKHTLNNTIVMGKNTFLSIGKALPNRKNIVISKTLDASLYKDIEVYDDIEQFYNEYKNRDESIFIIGGKSIYDYFINKCSILYVSKLNSAYECDLFMDNSFDGFEIVNQKEYEQFTFFEYRKV
ncbi:dihydrofolate reductase [Malacoplasma penetrans]|uniref:dihydrofolate reductase n=1 Tax=Malacoplasma penetrans (strain HF-2) TaxID=272633 RepID=Q8EV82_MALP2|nr:dihydrofolate reductase [Malacoplasma penetrans]RXY96256.1 dihydrofolate reductase [Malacoplasma penetrans]BAC44478.1 dihyrofolate reductase [Malacoplasma penetrans HF-2]